MLRFTDPLSITARLSFLLLIAFQISGCKSPSERAQAYYEAGAKLLAQHDKQRAALEFKNAIILKRDLVPAWRGLAQIEESDRRWGSSSRSCERFWKLTPRTTQQDSSLPSFFSSLEQPINP